MLNIPRCSSLKTLFRITIGFPCARVNLLFFRFRSWKVMFFGSDDFSLCNLKEVFRHTGPEKLVSYLEVTTVPYKENPVQQFAESNYIKLHNWPPVLKDSFDIGVVVSFGKLIPSKIINYFPLGMINVHASLLPKYRGATPIIHAIMNGDSVTGVTIMQIEARKFDIGGVIKQKSLNIDKDETMPSLRGRLAILGAECLIETLQILPNCLETIKKQPEENISYAPQITSSTAFIQWNNMTANQIYNRHRALFSIYNLRTTFLGKPLKVLNLKISLLKEPSLECSNCPGNFEFLKKEKLLQVQCKNSHIYIDGVVYSGKALKTADFYYAHLRKIPKTEWKFV